MPSVVVVADALREAGLLTDVFGDLPTTVTDITDDSRRVRAGGIFVAVRGSAGDGHDYLAAAEKAGAALAIVEDWSRTALPVLVVTDARRAAAVAAGAFHGWPARQLVMVGVTGTNGKTTTVGMLRHLLDGEAGHRAASIGTLGVLVGSEGTPLDGGSGLTTPGPVELQGVLARLGQQGVRRVAMEVSSHALDQRRVEGIQFDAGVFTNFTRDHLDYHGTMEAYFAAKARLVDAVRKDGTVVVNADDLAWEALPHTRAQLRFALSDDGADVRGEQVRFSPRGSTWTLVAHGERSGVALPLIGDFNVANALGAAATALALGMTVPEVTARLATLPQVPGRLEVLREAPVVLRDYAHTPDALERAIAAVRPFTPGRLIVVFGCGGDRDRGKRPVMGHVAATRADIAIVTSDNPRTEDPEKILDEIEVGMLGIPHQRIENRRAAIAAALDLADADDVILLAGKGHEDYQIRGTVKEPFDEKVIVAELSAQRGGVRSAL